MSRSTVLVDVDWVEAHLDDPQVVLVEVDENTAAYDKNHIRGAIRDSGTCRGGRWAYSQGPGMTSQPRRDSAVGLTAGSDGHCGRLWREGAHRDYEYR